MTQDTEVQRRPRFWIGLVALVMALIFLYFYKPFEVYVVAAIPQIHFSNVIFWFASLVGVVGYFVAHWQSFRQKMFRAPGDIDVEALLFDSLQTAILVAVIFCAGAILQAVEQLSALLMMGSNEGGGFVERIVTIVLLIILTVLFGLLHYFIKSLRTGWRPRRPPSSVHP